MDTTPVLKKRRGISPVWTLPVIAAVLCAWLLYKSFLEAGIEIEVFFADATGLTPEKTQIMSMGIPVGVVKEMHPDVDRGRVRTVIRMDRSTEPFLVEDTQFWIVRPEISASRITGLETILRGSYIGIQPGASMQPAREFTGLSSAPPVSPDAPGLHIKLKSSALRSIQEGSNIYFRNIKIGSVQSYRLQEDDSVLIDCYILPEYRQLIHTGSRFYDASGVTFSGKLTNLKIHMESLASLFIGGIVVTTPKELEDTPESEDGEVFVLYEDFEAANYGIPMTLKLASGANITEGVTKVMYRGLEAGYVKRITINDDEERSVTAQILLDPRAEIILREGTRFWMVSPEISADGISNLNTLITGSYITFKPGQGPFTDHFEILPAPPNVPPLRPGRTYVLNSADSAFPGSGAPVYYRKVQIGEVLGSELAEDRDSVQTTVFIYESYADVITERSVFITSSGISIDASISGLSIDVAPAKALLKGGIDVVNFKNGSGGTGQSSSPEAPLTLFADLDSAFAALPHLKPEGLYLRLSVDGESYRPGTPILFKKIKVGQVLGFRLSPQKKDTLLSCFIEKQYAELVSTASKFYRASGLRIQGSLTGFSVDTESLEALVSGGIAFVTPPGGTVPPPDYTFEVSGSRQEALAGEKTSVRVRLRKADQLTEGALIKYRGITLGSVQKVTLDKDLESVVAAVDVDKPYETLFRRHTKIWLSSPQVSLNGIRNLQAVVFGPHLTIEPGSGELSRDFEALSSPPKPFNTSSGGLDIVLEAKHLGSLDIGSPVYYRQVKIGEVTGYTLAFDFKDVLISVAIDNRYAAIVRENSRFWNASGLTVKGGLFSGLSVSTQSIESLVAGGIALATPGKEEMGPPVYTGYHFVLYDAPEDGWLDWSPEIFAVEAEQGNIAP